MTPKPKDEKTSLKGRSISKRERYHSQPTYDHLFHFCINILGYTNRPQRKSPVKSFLSKVCEVIYYEYPDFRQIKML